MGSKAKWLLIGLGLYISLVVVARVLRPDMEPRPARAETTAQPSSDLLVMLSACRAAQDAVRQRLKTPRTAEFESCSGTAHQIRATPDRRTFWVFGSVDADNPQGAKLRKQFGVELTKGSGDLPSSFTPVVVEIE